MNAGIKASMPADLALEHGNFRLTVFGGERYVWKRELSQDPAKPTDAWALAEEVAGKLVTALKSTGSGNLGKMEIDWEATASTFAQVSRELMTTATKDLPVEIPRLGESAANLVESAMAKYRRAK